MPRTEVQKKLAVDLKPGPHGRQSLALCETAPSRGLHHVPQVTHLDPMMKKPTPAQSQCCREVIGANPCGPALYVDHLKKCLH